MDLIQNYEEASGSTIEKASQGNTDPSRIEIPTITSRTVGKVIKATRQTSKPRQAPLLPTRQTLLEIKIPNRPAPKVAPESEAVTRSKASEAIPKVITLSLAPNLAIMPPRTSPERRFKENANKASEIPANRIPAKSSDSQTSTFTTIAFRRSSRIADA